jgi:hypothetical protein
VSIQRETQKDLKTEKGGVVIGHNKTEKKIGKTRKKGTEG